ncbi:MAG: non-hydrolyzing UDP-N-acetylglucosamine 2-epimerase [Nitrospirota bacterium]
MGTQKKIMVVLGTRPEAIKLAPVISALNEDSTFTTVVLATAQHRNMLDQVLSLFRISPDYDLNIMTENQQLTEVTGKGLHGVDEVLKKERPDMVLVQGDTTTVFAASLAAYYNRIPVGHVEAGLRTADKYSPFPEEMNRRLATVLADLHFAPTEWARKNLVLEGVPEERIVVTGNTIVDALMGIPATSFYAGEEFPRISTFLRSVPKVILVTAHRRENFGQPFKEMCAAMRELVDRNADVGIIYPVHPNPNVRSTVSMAMGQHPRILLVEPLDYITFINLIRCAYLILTDSGGVQEEAPSFKKPVLIMRENTERPEGVNAGVARLVGTRKEMIVAEVTKLLKSEHEYAMMAKGINPFGDGKAAARIVGAIKEFLAPFN